MKRTLPRAAVSVFAISFVLLVTRPGAAATEAPAVVFVDHVKATELFETLSYPARVIPRFNTTILAETDGIVSRIFAPLGERVSPRQKIFAISHTDPIYQYAPVYMLAPVSGIVSSVEVTEGSQVTKGEKLGSVTDPTQVRVSVEVPAQDLAYLKKGMPGEFRFAGSDEKVLLQVRGISPFVDPATGTATCELELQSKKSALAPGVLGQVSFRANAHQGISIPDYAVIYRGTDTLVRVIDDSQKALQLPVKLGRKERGNVEVLSGLKNDTKLVLRSSRYVADGEAVTVQDAGAQVQGQPQ
jgi:multidrug efflux pump subunit AcrA (membrane-fusion protein)